MKADEGDVKETWGKATFKTLFTCYMLENLLLCNIIRGESADDLFIPSMGMIRDPSGEPIYKATGRKPSVCWKNKMEKQRTLLCLHENKHIERPAFHIVDSSYLLCVFVVSFTKISIDPRRTWFSRNITYSLTRTVFSLYCTYEKRKQTKKIFVYALMSFLC